VTRQERLEWLARRLYRINQLRGGVEDRRDETRKEFFRLVTDNFRKKEHLLPVRTIEVPDGFFDKTGMTRFDFVMTRFPGWMVEHCERNTATGITVFVLKKDPHYMPDTIDVEDDEGTIRVAKEVSEATPEIDWDSLQKERPDLYEKLAREKVVLEVNDEALEKMVTEEPEDMAVLQRHLKVKEPSLKVRARRLKDG